MNQSNVFRTTMRMLVALLTVSLLTTVLTAQNAVTFKLTADGNPVGGLVVDVNGLLQKKTNPSGEAILYLPDGEYNYSVFTEGSPESITVGSSSIVYNDIGGQGTADSYDNYFVYDDTVTVSGTTIKNIALTTTTFNTTIGGSASPVEFDITAEHYIRSTYKQKTLTTVTSDAGGSISLPLPTHRDRRRSETIYEFSNYKYSAMEGLIAGTFDPESSPVNIDIPALNFVTFAVTAGDTAVEGITVSAGGITAKTNASGQVILNLPNGALKYSVYTPGSPESVIVGSNTFTYNDIGGDDKPDSYDNYFVYDDTLTVSGATAKDIALTTTTFVTTDQGSPASIEFAVTAAHSGGGSKVKTLTTVTSPAGGIINVPMPTYRDRRTGGFLEFINYMYSVIDDNVSGSFDPENSPVTINIPALNFATFTVKAGGTAVEGVTVDVDGVTGKTNATGQVILNLPDGDLHYSVYIEGSPESITVGENTFTYLDIGGRDKPDSYDNYFVYNDTVAVSGAIAKNISLTTTTFNTTDAGSAAPVEFDITADYIGGGSRVKTLASVTSDAGGTISLPLPTHRDRRRSSDIYAFTDYKYLAADGLITGTFDPEISPVNIDVPAMNEVTITVTAADTAVEGITVDLGIVAGKTDASGQVVFTLYDDDFPYTVYTEGTPEVITVGVNTFTYLDDGGRSNRMNRYDNYFVVEDTVKVSGTTMKNVALATTLFNTTIGGSAAPVEFEITAGYISSKGPQVKTITTVTSDAAGTINLPLPTHRDTRKDDMFEFIDHMYSANGGRTTGSFNPEISPVNIDLPTHNDVTFKVTAGYTAVEGIILDLEGTKIKTDTAGQAVFNLPDGKFSYSVYTEGSHESIIVGANTFTYLDIGGQGTPDSYDNFFAYNDSVTVSGGIAEDITLTTTTFNTTDEGSATAVEFDVTAYHSEGGDEVKTLTSLTSSAGGTISLPLPTHRDNRSGDIFKFIDYEYSAAGGLITGSFDPEISPVNIDIPVLNEVTFTVTAGDTAVEGITVAVGDMIGLTDAAGQTIFNVPDGKFPYSVYTEGSPESIIIGVNTFIYNDIGGQGKADSYDNFFIIDDTVTVSGVTEKNVALITTTFNTTAGGIAASFEFSLMADYDGGGEKTKTLTTVTSGADGTISLPLPIYRDTREGDIYEFTNYRFSDAAGSTFGLFSPEISPVNITLPALGSVNFTVKAGAIGVEGIIVSINDIKIKTDATGQALFDDIPSGYYDYSIYTEGLPEYITVGQNTFIYYDIGGNGKLDSYDNIFVLSDTVAVSGAMEKDAALTTTTFNTTVGGSAAPVELEIKADYFGGGSKVKTITTVTSGADGEIGVPLPTHRDRRRYDDIFEFINYRYSAMGGLVTEMFDPEVSPVNIDIPALNEVTFTVKAGGNAVEGITVGVEEVTGMTDESGQVVLSIPDGDLTYSVYTEGSSESIIVGANTFTYLDLGGRGNPDSYDNFFIYDETVTISGAMDVDVTLTTTTFNTTLGGSPAPVEFDILANYSGGGGKTKTLTSVTSDAGGTISLPLPTHRDRRERDDIFEFNSYRYSAFGGLFTGAFDPENGPVNIDIPALNEVSFTVTAGDSAVEGITVDVEGLSGKTDASGQVILNLPDGYYSYSVYTGGTPESIIIGANTFTYNDMGGRGNPDSYDNIFIDDDTITVSGAMERDVKLVTTKFITTVGGDSAAATFSITADDKVGNSDLKTLITVTSGADGTLSLPLPTHRDRRSGTSIYEFVDFMYSAAGGNVTGSFDPGNSPVNIDLPALNEVTFTVTAGAAVEGITVDVNGSTGKTDASGQVILSLPDGNFAYSVYTGSTPEIINVGVNTFTYNDIGGDGRTNSYDNFFIYNDTVTVSGAREKDVTIATTTFNTIVGGSPAPISFSITADYSGGGGKTKTLTTVVSGADGTLILPLPTHRDRREDNDIMEFQNYMYEVTGSTVSGAFNPKNSPVLIALESSNKVTFTVTNDKTSDPILGVVISINGVAHQATDINGETTTYLPDGTYLYTVSMNGYEDVDYTLFTLSGSDLSVGVNMTPTTSLKSITFIVTDDATSDPIQGAVISINGMAPVTTDASGEAVVYLLAGNYSYTISKAGYEDVSSSSLTISGTDQSIPISMTVGTGIDKREVTTFVCYPNPAKEFVTVRFDEQFTGTIELWSIMGKLLMQEQVYSELTRTINISEMSGGFYILRAGAKSLHLIIK